MKRIGAFLAAIISLWTSSVYAQTVFDATPGGVSLSTGTGTVGDNAIVKFEGTTGTLINDDFAFLTGTSLELRPHGISSGDTLSLKFRELIANGGDSIGFKAPDSVPSPVLWTLPSTDGTANQALITTGSAILSWGNPEPGGTASGELTGTYPSPSLSNDAVIDKLLTGYLASAGVVSSVDSIIVGLEKLDGNITNVDAGAVHITGSETITGAKTFSTPIVGSLTGNSDTATALQTARTINGVPFNGTANITVTAAADTLTGTILASNVSASSLTSVGTLSSLTVSGTINGSINGNSATATALQTPRLINGVSFNGTSDIIVPAAAGTLTGSTLAPNVLSSSLVTLGTLTSLSVAGTVTVNTTGVINGNVDNPDLIGNGTTILHSSNNGYTAISGGNDYYTANTGGSNIEMYGINATGGLGGHIRYDAYEHHFRYLGDNTEFLSISTSGAFLNANGIFTMNNGVSDNLTVGTTTSTNKIFLPSSSAGENYIVFGNTSSTGTTALNLKAASNTSGSAKTITFPGNGPSAANLPLIGDASGTLSWGGDATLNSVTVGTGTLDDNGSFASYTNGTVITRANNSSFTAISGGTGYDGTSSTQGASITMIGRTLATFENNIFYRGTVHKFRNVNDTSLADLDSNGFTSTNLYTSGTGSVGVGTTNFGSGNNVVSILGTATTPSAVAGTGILYVTAAGALRYRGPTTDSLIALP